MQWAVHHAMSCQGLGFRAQQPCLTGLLNAHHGFIVSQLSQDARSRVVHITLSYKDRTEHTQEGDALKQRGRPRHIQTPMVKGARKENQIQSLALFCWAGNVGKHCAMSLSLTKYLLYSVIPWFHPEKTRFPGRVKHPSHSKMDRSWMSSSS